MPSCSVGACNFSSFCSSAGSVVDFAYSYSKYGVAAYSWSLPDRRANYLRAFTSIVPVLLTNVFVTALVGVKVWYVNSRAPPIPHLLTLPRTFRRSIKPALGRSSQTRVEKIMVLLVESGGIYSCIWVRAIAFGFISISASLTLFQLAYLVITLADKEKKQAA